MPSGFFSCHDHVGSLGDVAGMSRPIEREMTALPDRARDCHAIPAAL
jgi:hypothetical protein